jgi:hypothetical protein
VSAIAEVRRTAHRWRSSAAETSSSVQPRFVTQNDAARYRRQLVVIDEDDPARAYEPSEVDEVEEDPVEAVVAIHERQVKTPGFAEEARKRDLRLFRVMFYHLRDPRLFQELQPAIRKSRRLVGVQGDVSRHRVRVPEQALANEESRDAVAEADLDRPRRPLT